MRKRLKNDRPRVTRTNQTAENVRVFREYGALPPALTLRFLALLRPKELQKLARKLRVAVENHELPETGGEARKRRQWAQLERVQSEMRQRGMMK